MKKVSGYQQPYYYEGGDPKAANYREHDWTADHARGHIGDTMQPIQTTPRFSPYYVEFNEHLGGFNFGSGNCQLDFLNMQLDWACGRGRRKRVRRPPRPAPMSRQRAS